MNFEKFYKRACRRTCEIVPQKKREKSVYPNFAYGGIKEAYDIYLGKRMILVMLMGVIGFLIPLTIGGVFGLAFEADYSFGVGDFQVLISIAQIVLAVVVGLSFALLTAILVYIHLYYLVEGRSTLVENVLPDFLMLVSSNISAGMTPFSAFRSAARKEFGPLSEEIKIATAKALGTQSFTEALSEVSRKIKSRQLSESVAFFNQSLRSGGHLAKLLETSSNSLRQTQEMKKELLSSTKMYTIFVVFVVVIASPLLLGVSVQFLKMITAIQAEANVGAAIGGVAFLSAEMLITPEFMQMSAYFLLLVNSLLSSLFIGVLNTGKAKSGIKNFPLILIASFIVLFISLGFLEGFFAGFS